jgi:hypothetical protein
MSHLFKGPKRYPFAALFCLAAASCIGLDPDSSRTPKALGAIGFEIRESYSRIAAAGSPRIQLRLQTQQIFPCCNWSIAHAVSARPGVVGVQLNGIFQPDICLTATGPAVGESFVDLANGEYQLDFTSAGGIDRFTLTVTDAALEVTPGDGAVARPRATRIWRYPPNSLAYVCGTTTATTGMCAECLERVVTEAGLQEIHFGPEGVVPYPTTSSGHWVDTPARYFTYADAAAFQSAAAALIAYSRDVIGTQEGIGISIQNWRNEHVRSWQHAAVP